MNREILLRGIRSGISVTFLMAKVMIPCYMAIELIKYFEFVEPISRLFLPFTGLLGLPGEAALGIAAGFLINLYAALAVLTPLDLTPREMTICALILGISHSLPVETSVTKKTGVNYVPLLLIRIILSFLSGFGLSLLWRN